ncbi:Uncharacterised protein [Bordetella pertussis]|nr:Uncharacterised protein [Bordetella pertussis]
MNDPRRLMQSFRIVEPTWMLATGSSGLPLPTWAMASNLSWCTRVITCISPCAPTGLSANGL